MGASRDEETWGVVYIGNIFGDSIFSDNGFRGKFSSTTGKPEALLKRK